ncbi:type I-E CRISPR-associated protein Cse2/CasB [Desulfobacterales bacterium HSG16]|nr:type I-E CRISPR-associated protein Cse2/CasB [Desulfobacterales bacterium HSG16]
MQSKEKEKRIEVLIGSYKKLHNRARAELRKLENYDDVRVLAPEAFWSCHKILQEAGQKKFQNDVLSALLIFFRDRGSNSDNLKSSGQKLGKQFAGVKDVIPVKLGRFKRLMASEDMKTGFDILRKLLRLFRHEDVNWVETANFLNSLYWYGNNPTPDNKTSLNRAKKQIADAYFKTVLKIKKETA